MNDFLSMSLESHPIFFFVKVMIELFSLMLVFLHVFLLEANSILSSFNVLFIGMMDKIRKESLVVVCNRFDGFILCAFLNLCVLGVWKILLFSEFHVDLFNLGSNLSREGFYHVICRAGRLYVLILNLASLLSWLFEF